MKKFKWMNATFGIPLDALAENMRRMRFDPHEDDSEGFRINEQAPNQLSGLFIERETLLEQISLPTGEEYEEKRSRVTVTEFHITNRATLNLMLVSPPRKTIPFFNALSEAAQAQFFVEPLKVDVLRWIEQLEIGIGPIQVTYLDCNSIQLSPMVTGRFAFRGNDDVRAEVSKIIKNAKPSIESARCELTVDGIRSQIELFKTGAVKLGPEVSIELLARMSNALGVVI